MNNFLISRVMSCIKYLLFAFNFLFVIFGILLVYSGFKTVAQIDIYKDKYNEVIHDWPNDNAICLMVFGFVIFLTAFLGCFGVIRKSLYMLNTYIVIMFVICVVEVINAGMISDSISNFQQAAEVGIKKAIEKYSATQTDDPTNTALDDIQTHLKCCGADIYSDWFENHEYNRTRALPYSCCPNKTVNVQVCSKEMAYASGCVNEIDYEIRDSFGLVVGIGIATAIALFASFQISLFLGIALRKLHKMQQQQQQPPPQPTPQPPQRLSEHRIGTVVKLMVEFIKQRTAQKQQQQQAEQQQMQQIYYNMFSNKYNYSNHNSDNNT